jgi:hypothetical protein
MDQSLRQFPKVGLKNSTYDILLILSLKFQEQIIFNYAK